MLEEEGEPGLSSWTSLVLLVFRNDWWCHLQTVHGEESEEGWTEHAALRSTCVQDQCGGRVVSILTTWALWVRKSLIQIMELQYQLDYCVKSWSEVHDGILTWVLWGGSGLRRLDPLLICSPCCSTDVWNRWCPWCALERSSESTSFSAELEHQGGFTADRDSSKLQGSFRYPEKFPPVGQHAFWHLIWACSFPVVDLLTWCSHKTGARAGRLTYCGPFVISWMALFAFLNTPCRWLTLHSRGVKRQPQTDSSIHGFKSSWASKHSGVNLCCLWSFSYSIN